MRKRRSSKHKKTKNKRRIIIAGLVSAIIFCMFIFSDKTHKQVYKHETVSPNKNEVKSQQVTEFPIKYRHVNDVINKKPQNINILEIDLNSKNVEIKPVLSENHLTGLDYVSSLLTKSGAYAGVNGGFFGKYGLPQGLIAIDNEILTLSRGYPIFFVDKNNKVILSEIQSDIYIEYGDKKVKLDGLNSVPKRNQAILFTNKFGEDTKNSIRAYNILIKNNIVQKTFWSSKSTKISEDSQLLMIMGNRVKEFMGIKVGQKISVTREMKPDYQIKNAIECGPWLIKDGKSVVPSFDSWIGNTNTSKARTAIGLKNDSELILITVDGRQPKEGVGVTGKELANYLLDLGIENAAFLDGGVSTTMYLNANIVNIPEDKGKERKVGNALGIFLN